MVPLLLTLPEVRVVSLFQSENIDSGFHKGDLEMLSGNVASIGVGGIIAVVSSLIVRLPRPLRPTPTKYFYNLQWPEDFNFDITRAINAPALSSPSAESETPSLNEKEKSSAEAADAVSVKSEEEDDLDPAKLQKAFRFAAWSSIALVCRSLSAFRRCTLIHLVHDSYAYCCYWCHCHCSSRRQCSESADWKHGSSSA